MLKDIYYIYSIQQLLTWRSFSCQKEKNQKSLLYNKLILAKKKTKKNKNKQTHYILEVLLMIISDVFVNWLNISTYQIIKWFRKDIRYIFSSFSKTVQIFILFSCSNDIVRYILRDFNICE